MCIGENSANHAIHYVNAQLTALWENSVECTEHAGKNLKPLERIRYDFALHEFHVGSTQRSKTTGEPELMFSAIFGRPRIDFVCNHEAVLYLKIREGHFNRDFAKLNDSTFTPTRSRNVHIKDLELAFRLDFAVNTIKGTTANIGNGAHLIQLLVLNMDCKLFAILGLLYSFLIPPLPKAATLASKVQIPHAKEALAFYLKGYLDFLRQAGHHVLFSLPDFDDDGHQVQVEFSLLPHFIRNIEHDITEILGVALESINDTLSAKWLKNIMEAEEEHGSTHNKDAICLAEYRSTWTTIGDRKDIQFWIKFGAPKVKILCKKEAILSFTIEELLVFDGNDFKAKPKHIFKDWEIATVVNLIKKVKGTITTVEIDLKSLRVCEPLCIFAGFDLKLNWAATLKATVFEFFQIHYTSILEKVSAHIVWTHDNKPTWTPGYICGLPPAPQIDIPRLPSPTLIPTTPGTPSGSLPTPTPVEVGGDIMLKNTDSGEYDFLQVISVAGIVEHFKNLWVSYQTKAEAYAQCLVKWTYEEEFKASFGAINIKFLTGEKAMVWIHLEDCWLKSLNGDKHDTFMDWSIAFEVHLKVLEHEKVAKKSSSWFERFKESIAWKLHGHKEDSRTLHHLGLDFSSLQLGNRTAVGFIRAAVHYLTKHYFTDLTHHGHHILYSTPVWKSGSKPPSGALTSLSFQIYSKYTYTRETVDLSNAVLILLGMTNFKKHPKGHLEYSSEWVIGSEGVVSAGTVCLSRHVFFEDRLLKSLANINGSSTVVPNFCPNSNNESAAIFTGSDDEESEWGLALATWAQRTCVRRKAGKCDWKINTHKEESDYKWEYVDKWTYEHENSHDLGKNGAYKISCHTKNLLSFPPSHNGSLDIVLKGIVHVNLTFKGGKNWSTSLEAPWSSTLSFKSLPGGSGMSIEVTGDSNPNFKAISTDVPLDQLFNVKALHGLLRVELGGLASELRQSFGGVWEHCFLGSGALSLCNPIFNKHGDILFELRSYTPLTQTQIVTRPSVTVPETKHKKSLLRRIGSAVADVAVDFLDDGKFNHSNRSNGSVHHEKEIVSPAKVEGGIVKAQVFTETRPPTQTLPISAPDHKASV
ncbi:hypothetical protein Clacol_010334 [Clathrus columnatus]|uniref:Uncharacterized protein n=1 Tax=Clathrus columnatus TaxID=1419009 RepID=A0AAV5ATJ9_9AGAM|nr:hypothetical protein Clacol_010334 [Clathrus columnatus]